MKVIIAAVVAALLVVALGVSAVLFGDDDNLIASGGVGVLRLDAVPQAYQSAVTAAAGRCPEITGPVLAAQISAESGWNPQALSPAGARGIAQFMPATWAEWGHDYSGDGVADVFNATDAIGSQADYMCAIITWVTNQIDQHAVAGDPLQLALAAYNAGMGRVLSSGGIPAIDETRRYVERILAAIPSYTEAVLGAVSGNLPALSDDGTYRVPTPGSGRLDTSTLCHVPWASSGMILQCAAEHDLELLDAAFQTEFGEHLLIISAYRSYSAQVATRAAKGFMAATPGTSNHGWGLAVDFGNIGAEGSVRHDWLRANAPSYGWQHPSWARSGGSKPESWHWEYVGVNS